MHTPKPPSENNSRRFELLIEAVTDYAIYMLDLDGRVTSWNPGAERIKGYTADEIIGLSFSTFFPEEDRAAGKPALALATARRTGRFEEEGWRQRKDGSRFWALAVLDAVHDEDGTLIGFAKITRDMTERRAAEEALRESERRFRLLVQGVVDYSIFMLDPEGLITNWNFGAQRIKGYQASEIVGQHFSRFYTEEDRQNDLPARALAAALSEGKYEAEGWRVRKDGTQFWANVVIDPIRDETGQLVGFAKVTRDITDKREAQRKLDEAREQLFQAQKMEAIGQLTSGIAHDFNNLLTVVLGGAGIAERLAAGNDRLQRLIRNIRLAAERGEDLTKQLLAFAQRQTLRPQALDVAQQLQGLSTLLEGALRGDIALQIEPTSDLWIVEIDPSQLDLALLNLALNARDAMPDGGTLRVSARNVVLDGTEGGPAGRFVALRLQDSGAGIPDDIQRRVFEPFFTTKGVGKGTGLGLSQAYGFAQQSGGAITLTSHVGEGTTVTLYLPACMGLAAAPKQHAVADVAVAAGPSHVLVVEDDPAVAELVSGILEDAGYGIEVVDNSDAALRALREGVRVDAVFSDVMMPGEMNGAELAEVICDEFPQLPILLTTGYAEAVASAAVARFPLLTKPYQSRALLDALSRLLAKPQ